MNKHIALLLGGAALLAAVTLALTAGGAARALEPHRSRKRSARSSTRAAMSSRTSRIRSMPSIPRSEGSSVSQFSNSVPGTGVDVGLASERHDDVDIANELGVDGLWHWPC